MPTRKHHQTPKEGSVFERKFKGVTYKLEVVASPIGVAYKLGRTTFRTPTAAAKSITKTDVNGWVFWNLESR